MTLAYLLQVFGSIAELPGWLLDLSPFTHVAPVPAVSIDPTASVVMVLVALLAGAVGGLAFSHRDIATE